LRALNFVSSLIIAQLKINKEETEFEARIPQSEIRIQNGDIAQLGERLLCTQEVRGSNPLISTISIQCLPESA
jgi:hypothetical protein